MRIELVSRLGARLPGDGGPLEFGATEADARRRLEGLVGPVRTPFAGGVPWGWRARIGDRWVEANAGGDGLLGEIRVARAMIGAAVQGAAGIAVVYRGIDVFEHTMAEIEFLLGAGMGAGAGANPGANSSSGAGSGVSDLRLTGVSGYALSVTLLDLTRPQARG
jgi:hypothetical protein